MQALYREHLAPFLHLLPSGGGPALAPATVPFWPPTQSHKQIATIEALGVQKVELKVELNC